MMVMMMMIMMMIIIIIIIMMMIIAIPLQARTDPEVSRNLRLPDFKTAHEDGKAVSTGRLYPPGNIPGTHFC